MLHHILEEARSLPTDRPTLRRFGLMVGAVFVVIAIVWGWTWVSEWAIALFESDLARPGADAATGEPSSPPLGPVILGAVGLGLVAFGSVAPGLLRPIYLAWMTLALVLGSIMTRVLLTLVFYLLVTPIGLVLRVLGRDPMHRRPDASLETYWIEREASSNEPSRMEKFY